MNIALLTSHSIAEYDDLRMFTGLGYDTFSIGAYTDPRNPTDDKRPALDVPAHPDLALACHVQREKLGDPGPDIDAAKAHLHPDLIEWADAIIVHHFPERWIYGQWANIRHKRVIWRTCGQSSPDGSLERLMGQLKGLEIVRYSPRERSLPDYAGESAVIRFGKYIDDYPEWVGDVAVVGNVTQHMYQRGDSCGYPYWAEATRGLPVMPAGPGSEAIGGVGELTYDFMLQYLAHLRVYLYTGTRPASYTLGMMEAALVGVPIVSIGPNAFGFPELFDPLATWSGTDFDDPAHARDVLGRIIAEAPDERGSLLTRDRAQRAFGMDVIGPQWKAFLG